MQRSRTASNNYSAFLCYVLKMPTVISAFLRLNKAITPDTSKIMLTAVSTISIQCYPTSDAAHYLPKNANEQISYFGSCQPLFQKHTSLLCTT